jgi:putative FmdB family regulatory protein
VPIYEYVCSGCQQRFEKLVRRFGEPVSCPVCAGDKVDRQLSVFAVAVSSPSPAPVGCGAGACASGDGGCAAGDCGSGACGLAN